MSSNRKVKTHYVVVHGKGRRRKVGRKREREQESKRKKGNKAVGNTVNRTR